MENKVELLGYYGSDEVHCQSAWTSTSREITDEKRGRMDKLLNMLAKEGHETPFEKSSLHFLVTVDQATHIHLLKHRIGVSINGESARYKELKEDKYLIPDDWEGITAFNDSSRLDGMDWATVLEEYTSQGNILYHLCLEELTPILGRK